MLRCFWLVMKGQCTLERYGTSSFGEGKSNFGEWYAYFWCLFLVYGTHFLARSLCIFMVLVISYVLFFAEVTSKSVRYTPKQLSIFSISNSSFFFFFGYLLRIFIGVSYHRILRFMPNLLIQLIKNAPCSHSQTSLCAHAQTFLTLADCSRLRCVSKTFFTNALVLSLTQIMGLRADPN